MLEDILICPKSKSRITIDTADSIAHVEQSNNYYPIKDGIIDFLPDTADRVSKAYDAIASSYNDYANLSSLYWKLFTLLFWGFLDDKFLLDKMLSPIPSDFDGVLLDVPVGTGILTINKYQKLKKAKIIALDYSLGMLEKAKHLYTENGLDNVTFIRGDVGSLPIADNSIDLCLSMGGFHAFSDKTLALSEIVRVLKGNNLFTGGYYIKGKRLLTDLLVRHILTRKGYFSAPFYNEQESLSKFREFFNIEYTTTMKSFFVFAMNKKN